MKSPLSTTVDFQADRAKLFARAPAKIFFGHIASACVLIYLAWDVLPLHWILLWAILELLITPTLLYLLAKQIENQNRRKVSLDIWQNRLHALFALVGVSWGTFMFFGLDIDNPAHFSIQMAIVAGAAASASRSLGIFKFAYYFYVIPFNGLLAIRVFMIGGDFVLLGVLVVIFMVMMSGLANDTSEELSKYLATKSDNLELAEKYRAAAAEADQANSAKSRFLAQANHDLRQPIHAIALLTQCLRVHKINEDASEILDTIDSSVDSLSKLFKSLLNVTSLDSGELKLDETVFPLNEIISQTVRQALPEAKERNCELRFVPNSAWVKCDKALLASILQNLVFNAVKYAPNSTILVGVRVNEKQLSIHVLDQGPGVPEQLVSRVFEEFVRGNPEGPRRIDGLGLGLSIVSRTSKLLGLDVEFRSEEGKGTHVRVSGLNRASLKQQTLPRTSQIEHPTVNGTKVLVVDDSLEVLFGMETLLSSWGYAVTACQPKEAFAIKPDMLLMDLHLNGDVNGIELARNIQQKLTMPIPTAIISGTIDSETEKLAREAGYWTLVKPVPALQLRSVLLAMASKDVSVGV